MKHDFAIIPECYADTNLIETLVPPLKGYNHQKGCNTVVKIMREKLKDQFALGIIDKDEVVVCYLNECNEIVSTDSLSLFRHKTRYHYIIRISPAIEGFILKCAEDTGVKLSTLGLPDNVKSLTARTKVQVSKHDPVLKNLFRELSSATEMKVLRAWIEYLKANPYTADENILISLSS